MMTNHAEKDTRLLTPKARFSLEHTPQFTAREVRLFDHADFMDEELARVTSERDALRPVVEASIRRRIAWLIDDDDAENVAADLAEDAAVDTYRALLESKESKP